MNRSTFRFIESHTLSSIQEFVRQRSQIDGPLLAMGPCPDIGNLQTFFAFEAGSADPDSASILLKVHTADLPPAVVGHKAFCVGQCVVDNQFQRVAAYRPV